MQSTFLQEVIIGKADFDGEPMSWRRRRPNKARAKHGTAAAIKILASAGVCDLTGEGSAAKRRDIPVEDAWGVGPATAVKLAALGIATAGLRDLPPTRLWALGTVALERTVWKLRSVSCNSL